MENSIHYTEREKTPDQRQQLIDKARAWSKAQGATPTDRAEALYARYVAGELTLQGVTDVLRRQDAAKSLTSALAAASMGPGLVPTAPAPASQPAMQPENLLLA